MKSDHREQYEKIKQRMIAEDDRRKKTIGDVATSISNQQNQKDTDFNNKIIGLVGEFVLEMIKNDAPHATTQTVIRPIEPTTPRRKLYGLWRGDQDALSIKSQEEDRVPGYKLGNASDRLGYTILLDGSLKIDRPHDHANVNGNLTGYVQPADYHEAFTKMGMKSVEDVEDKLNEIRARVLPNDPRA